MVEEASLIISTLGNICGTVVMVVIMATEFTVAQAMVLDRLTSADITSATAQGPLITATTTLTTATKNLTTASTTQATVINPPT